MFHSEPRHHTSLATYLPAPPLSHMATHLVDETLALLDLATIQPGDVVGIGVHTGNALRGYEVGRNARARGAYVIYGGIHATLYPEEALELGGAHAVVKAMAMLFGRTRWLTASAARRRPFTRAAASMLTSFRRPMGPDSAQELYVGLGANGSRLSQACSSVPCGVRMGRSPVRDQSMRLSKRSCSCGASVFASSPSPTTTSIPSR